MAWQSAVEHVTRFVLLEPLKTLTAEETCEFFFKRVFMVMGLPNCILTDNGAAWRSQLTQTLLEKLGIDSLKCLAYHSQANGMAERFLQKTQRKLQLFVNEKQDDWSIYVAPIQYSMNNSFCRTLGMEDTPYSLMFGRDARTSLDFEWAEVSTYGSNNSINTDFKMAKMIRLANTYRKVSQMQGQSSQLYSRYSNTREYNPEISIGDRVMLKAIRSRPNKSRALTKSYEGLFRVLDVMDYAVLIVPVAMPDAKPKLASKKRLKLIKSESYTPHVQKPILEFWQEIKEADLLQDPPTELVEDDEDIPDDSGMLETSTDQPEDAGDQMQPDEAEIMAIDYPGIDDGESNTGPDVEGEQDRPHGLRPRPRRRSFGDDFVTDLDQLRVMKIQKSWKTFM